MVWLHYLDENTSPSYFVKSCFLYRKERKKNYYTHTEAKKALMLQDNEVKMVQLVGTLFPSWKLKVIAWFLFPYLPFEARHYFKAQYYDSLTNEWRYIFYVFNLLNITHKAKLS